MVMSMVRGDGQGVWTDCEMVISHSRYVVVKSCWSRDAGCLPGACGILGRRKNEVLPWASRHIDLICEVHIRCETSCMRCHGGRGLRLNNMWYMLSLIVSYTSNNFIPLSVCHLYQIFSPWNFLSSVSALHKSSKNMVSSELSVPTLRSSISSVVTSLNIFPLMIIERCFKRVI